MPSKHQSVKDKRSEFRSFVLCVTETERMCVHEREREREREREKKKEREVKRQNNACMIHTKAT